MHRRITGPVLALSALLFPFTANAANGVASLTEEPPAAEAPPAGGEEEEEEEELILDDEMEAAPTEEPPGAPGGNDDFLNIGGEDDPAGDQALPGQEGGAEGAAAAPTISPEEQAKIDQRMITVVQRQAFLNVYKNDEGKTIRRFDLQPQVGLSINDPFVRHVSVGGEFNYWLTNRMAIGVTGTAFFGNKTPAFDRVRFQNGLLLTANRAVWEASAVYLYEPFYGKIAFFNRALLHWEAYTQLGAGIIQTRVIPRFESIHDPFNNFNPQGNFAIGSRFYVSGLDFMSFNFAVRTFIYPDTFEPTNRGPNDDPSAGGQVVDDPSLIDAGNAKDAGDTRVSFTTTVFFGVSFYLPPKFQYSTRR